MSGIEEALRERANDSDDIREPFISVIVTVEENVEFQEAQLEVGGIRRDVEQQLSRSSGLVETVSQDYTVDSFAAETIGGMEWGDLREIKVALEGAVSDAGYTIKGTSVTAETRRPSF